MAGTAIGAGHRASETAYLSPFSREFSTEPTKDRLDEALLIGTATDMPDPKPRSSGKRAPARDSMNSVLAAT